jgi:hypothetical protein
MVRTRAAHRALRIVAVLVLAIGGGGLLARPALAATSQSSSAAVPLAAAAETLSYNYTYTTGIPWPQTQLQTPASVTTEVTNNFTRYFPFGSNCTSLPAVGGRCDLYSVGTTNPVLVYARTATSFTFLSLPGHAEGANRFITFTFYKTGIDPQGDIRLQAYATGPWTLAAYLTIQSGQAYAFWNQFATNVGRAYGG